MPGGDWSSGVCSSDLDDPDQLRPIGAVKPRAFVADHQQVTREERYDGMGEAGVGRMVVPARDHLRARLVGDVERDQAAIDIPHVHAVWPLGIDVGVVRPETAVELGMAYRRRDVIALLRAGQPPPTDLDRL